MNPELPALDQMVREVLSHLYDHTYLQVHPLAQQIAAQGEKEAFAVTLHRVLMEAIETLRPPASTPASDAAWRPYLTLHLRYVEGRDVQDAASELAISPRQFRREHARGVDALTNLLARQIVEHSATDEAQTSTEETLTSTQALAKEVSRFGTPSTTKAAPTFSDALSSACATLAERAASSNITLSYDVTPNLPHAAVDRVVLRQIVLNILSSMIESVSTGTIALYATAYGIANVELRFSYRGENRPALLNTTGSNRARLDVASQLIQMQSGELIAENEKGADILVRLPTQQLAPVVVVDDNPDIVQLFRRYLRGSHYQCIGCTQSQEVIATAQRIAPCVIVLDVMMPDHDGWEVLQLLKRHPSTQAIPIIICSVLPEKNLALTLGAQDFLAKPVTQQSLLAALGRCTLGMVV